MKKIYYKVIIFLLISSLLLAFQGGINKSKKILLPNGWSLTPVGKSLTLGDLPLNIAASNSGKFLAVTNNGQSEQSIQLIDTRTLKILDNVVIAKSWYGLVFSSDDKYLFASGGNDNWILRYAIKKNKLSVLDTLKLGKIWPEKISPAGISLDENKNILYIVTKENNSLYIINIATKKIISIYPLGGEGYTCLLSPDKTELYISCWGCNKILVFDTNLKTFSSKISVGNNPNEMCLTKTGKFLFVANANDNSVSVVDLKKRKVIETLNTALYPNSPSGSTPNSVALSEDDKTLYIANADNNCLSVFDVSNPGFSKSIGFIPTGWYPTSVRIVKGKVFVANGKGISSMANPHGPNPVSKLQKTFYQKGDTTKTFKTQYIGGLFKGTLSIIKTPDNKTLANYSKLVFENTPYQKENELSTQGESGNPIPQKVGDISPIKHVFYIIKENRTYDQVLGDLPEGNGDTSLVLFGNYYTPNQHKLAKEFVLLDNFYVDAEVSADGHSWSTGAYATDYLEKTWPTSYGNRGGDYDGEGSRAIANNKEYIWDICKKNKISYRSYGEFIHDGKPSISSLKNHFCTHFTEWDLSVRDTTRFYQWKRDFDSLLIIGQVPQFSTLHFITDHTEGLRKGKPTPFAYVADNDLAVGLFIDYLSHSKIWKESVVFIVEDDAQDGPDHVDAHRSTAYVAGGYVKRNFVDHTMYSTSSILRTIELILGLTPMSQYDAASTPFWRSFSKTQNETPFTYIPTNVNLDDKNFTFNYWQQKSEELNFSEADLAPDDEFNEIIWHAVKGINAEYPIIKRAAFVKGKNHKIN